VKGKTMPKLYNEATNKMFAEITSAQLQFIIDNLEEEDVKDTDYYFDQATIDFLMEQGADDELIEILQKELGDQEGIDVRYEK
jgi:hypothetical protein